MPHDSNDLKLQAVKHWVESVVIGLQLCPFAKKSFMRQGIRFVVSEATTKESLLMDLQYELNLIHADADIETTLVIHPYVLHQFGPFNEFLTYADELIEEMGLTGVFQIASFHPEYQFADSLPDSVENYTNRSPYPILHIIDEEQLELAIATYPDVHSIPTRNKQLLREMGTEKMKAMLKACFL